VRDPVRTTLNFLAPMDGPVRTYTFDPPDGGPRFNGRLAGHAVEVHDGRPLRGQLGLDGAGFTLADQASAVHDWADEAEVRATAYAEAEDLLCALTGARQARVFDHTLRRRQPHKPPLDGAGGSFAAVREPVGRVHADYTPWSAPARLQAVLGDAAAACLARRYAIVGLWRPLNDEPLRDAPLAMADARSVSPGDMVTNELVYPDRRGETYIGRHNAAQRWFWFPEQTRDEVIVFKNFDSGTGQVVPHTAFDDPGAPIDAPPRRSIELRAFVFY
jgi:hypothetical protein